MKYLVKKFLLISSIIVVLCALTSCGSKEVNSRDEANRVLLSVGSEIAECELSLNDWEEDLDSVKESDLNNIEKRLNKCYSNIISCDSYKEVEDVAPKYNNAMDYYERAMTHLERIRKVIASED